MAEASTIAYSGPLFQLNNGSSTLDIGQTPGHKADMTTWSAFCGGSNSTSGGITTNSVCKVSKIYAQFHRSPNDLVPSVFSATFGPDCSGGGTTCACKFRYETATGLPILYKVGEICEYTLASDQSALAINGGRNAISVLVNGIANTANQCCGDIGISHKYNAGDSAGTDFLVGTTFGIGTPGVTANCSTSSKYCFGIDIEGDTWLHDFTVFTPGAPAFIVITYDGSNTTTGWTNGTEVFSEAPKQSPLVPGSSVHIGGGGDLSQPADLAAREWAITNTALSSGDIAAAFSQVQANFAGSLTFGDLH
jgi:hypothetical protein